MTRLVTFAKLTLAVTLVAIASGGFAIAFRGSLSAATKLFGASNIVDVMTAAPWWQRLIMPAIGGLLAGLISIVIAKKAPQGGGVANLMEAIVLGRVRVPLVRSIL